METLDHQGRVRIVRPEMGSAKVRYMFDESGNLVRSSMRVSVADVSQAFEDLLDGRRTREQIAEWASSARRSGDAGKLEYVPAADEERIWSGILYLMGVDLKVGPASYLHNREDFERFRAEWEGACCP